MPTVTAYNLAEDITEKQISEFFSFCGKISTISINNSKDNSSNSKCADITFDRISAAKTALLLQDAQLGASKIKVSSNIPLDDTTGDSATMPSPDGTIQEDKPRAAILAEYLAHGYVIGDSALQKSIDFDHQHGISNRFTNFLNSAIHQVDSTFGVSDKTKEIDEKFKVKEKSQNALSKFGAYFESALETPAGKKICDFYTASQKEVLDIHAEARRLANIREGKAMSEAEAEIGEPKVSSNV